jgi:hypothetical protein
MRGMGHLILVYSSLYVSIHFYYVEYSKIMLN